ncbi:hypothetical protein HK100_012671 [Physocladia obscura]|uniref:Uncharacterized protein n=1 Tax=Physocladia obscura TaxID=109957 RepID=A0AAD5TAT7_9FUNG|nr:hypothetical protein HK100_012671 [Physocladia obscura]
MNADAIDISDAAPSTPTPLSPPPPTSQSLLFTTSPLSDLGLKSTSTVSSTSVSSATTTNKPTTATTTTVTASTIVVDNDEDFASLKFHRGVLPEPTLVDYESQPTNSPQISKLNPDPDLESISSLANNTGRASLTLEVDNLVKIQNLICTDIDNSNDNPSSKRQKLSPSLPHKPPPTPPSATLESIDGLTTTATSPSSIRPNNANNHYSLLMSLLPTADGANTQFSEFLDNTRALPSFPAQQRPRPPSMPEIRFPPLFSDNQQCQLSVDSTHEDNSDDHYQFSQPASKSTYTPYRPPTSRGAHNPAIRCLLCGGLRHEFFESCERGSLESIQIIYDMYDNLIRCDDCTTNEDEKMVLRDVWTGECTAGTKCKREAHVTDSNDVAAAFTVEAVKIRMWRLVHLDRVLTRAEREMDEIGMAHPYPNRVRMSDLMKRRTARKTTATAVDEFVIEIL